MRTVKHRALAAAVLHTVQCDLLCHARRGHLPDHIPIAIIAGNKGQGTTSSSQAKKQKVPVKLQWLSGAVNIPKACGNRFFYSVTDFGCFGTGSDFDVHSIKQALSVYIGSILFGFTSAIRAYDGIIAKNDLPSPVAASGRHVMIGERALELELCASPIRGANHFKTQNVVDFWKSTQGELFKGYLSVGDVLRADELATMQLVQCLFQKPGTGKGKVGTGKPPAVMVKVSSCAVHDLLIDPIHTMMALLQISRFPGELVREIGTVLYAAVQTNCGLVTVMADLSKQGYRSLRPSKYAGKLKLLWGGFRELVEKVLLPLAAIGVVHADIRPGFDITSNILLKFSKKDEKASMKLVDYESLVLLVDWRYPLINGSYIGGEHKWTATTFVWWQCVSVGYTWCKKLIMSNVEQSNRISDLQKQLLRGSKDIGQWNELSGYARQATISAECVIKTLDTMEIFLLH